MKTAAISLVISVTILILSLFQFSRYQTFTHNTSIHIQQIDAAFNKKIESLNQQIADLEKQERSLAQQVQMSTLRVNEAESLVFLARSRLQTDQNANVAIVLLKAALEKIGIIQDPHLLPLKQALTNDIAALQNVSFLNVEECWLRVSALLEEASHLHPRNFIPVDQSLETSSQSQSVGSPISKPEHSWKEILQTTLNSIKDLIKIRRSSQPIEPVLSEVQQACANTTLRILLEQARASVLLREEKIFQETLKNALQWLTQYYDHSLPQVASLQSALASLQTVHFHTELPMMTSVQQFESLR